MKEIYSKLIPVLELYVKLRLGIKSPFKRYEHFSKMFLVFFQLSNKINKTGTFPPWDKVS